MYGAENMLLHLCRVLPAHGCDVVAGVFRNEHSPNLEIAQRLRAEHVAVEEIPCGGRIDWAALRRIRHIIRSTKADLVHCHGYKSDVYAYLATRLTAIPLVATAHNWTGKTQVRPIYNRLDRLALRRFAFVAAVSDGVAQVLLGSRVAQQKIVRIANGIDLGSFEKAVPTLAPEVRKDGVPVVGMVGRLVQEKGCDYFLRSAAEILTRFPGVLFVLVGDGPERGSLEQLARELGIENNVSFLGHQSDMAGVYASLDICVLPSFVEGMPMTVLEAMAAGKPVIATNVGEVPNVVEQEVTGLVVTPGSVSELSAALARLLNDADLCRRMGKTGRQKARKSFSADLMAEKYLALYQQALRGHPSHAAARFQRA